MCDLRFLFIRVVVLVPSFRHSFRLSCIWDSFFAIMNTTKEYMNREEFLMKGYIVHNGYMGYIGGSYRLFASESDYREYFED